jgi:hypothetical protein
MDESYLSRNWQDKKAESSVRELKLRLVSDIGMSMFKKEEEEESY